MTAFDKLETIVLMIEHLIKTGQTETLAVLLMKQHLEYTQLAKLATDGEYDANTWTHKNVMDFVTKGEI